MEVVMDAKEKFVLDYLKKEYENHNPFYNLLDINIEKAYRGHAIQIMKLSAQKHTNLYDRVHGGAIMSIGDSCMGVACASLGKKVVTLDTNINFIKNINVLSTKNATITAEAQVIHNGNKTIVMGAKLYDGEGNVLSIMKSTYFVIGIFEEIAQNG